MIIMNSGSQFSGVSRLGDDISSDSSTSSGLSTIATRYTSSCHLFGRDNEEVHRSVLEQHLAHEPLRSRTSSDFSWFSASEDEDDGDADEDLIPAIHKTINACALYYDDDQTSVTCSSSSFASLSPTGSIRGHVSFDELSLMQGKFLDLSSGTNSFRSRAVQFSEDPPSVFRYERPEPQYHFLLYYDEDEMDDMMNDYMSERC